MLCSSTSSLPQRRANYQKSGFGQRCLAVAVGAQTCSFQAFPWRASPSYQVAQRGCWCLPGTGPPSLCGEVLCRVGRLAGSLASAQGPLAHLATVHPVPKAPDSFRGLQKCFNFNFTLRSEEKKEHNNNKYTSMNPAWIIFFFTPT